jgi:hypothetical protein
LSFGEYPLLISDREELMLVGFFADNVGKHTLESGSDVVTVTWHKATKTLHESQIQGILSCQVRNLATPEAAAKKRVLMCCDDRGVSTWRKYRSIASGLCREYLGDSQVAIGYRT